MSSLVPYSILLLDKPLGITSHQAVTSVRLAYGLKKAGHGGTLDPLASGLLPIFLGSSTKFSRFSLGEKKVYRVVAQLGEETDTGDKEGRCIARAMTPPYEDKDIFFVLKKFLGPQIQKPPLFSAVKRAGKPLYHYARNNIPVSVLERSIYIFDIQLEAYSGQELVLKIVCSKGTYIRTLIEQIGRALGCYAHVAMLRRIGLDPALFCNSLPLVPLSHILNPDLGKHINQYLVPIYQWFVGFPRLMVSTSVFQQIICGRKDLQLNAVPGWIQIWCTDYGFCGLIQLCQDGYLLDRCIFPMELLKCRPV